MSWLRTSTFITQNWRGKPLLDLATIVKLIAGTRTTTGLEIRCRLDSRRYHDKRSVTDAEMAALRLRPNTFHGEWNYTFLPAPRRRS